MERDLFRPVRQRDVFDHVLGSMYCVRGRRHRSDMRRRAGIRRHGGRVTVNADAHEPAALAFGFDEALEQLKNTGFFSVFV